MTRRRWFAIGIVGALGAGAWVLRPSRLATPPAGSRDFAYPPSTAQPHPTFEQLHQTAREHAAAGRSFSAIWALQDASRLRPDDLETQLDIASLLARAISPGYAATELAALVKRHPASPRARLLLARMRRATGRPEAALAVLALPSASFDATPELRMERARNLQAAGRLTDAESDYARYLSLRPADAQGYLRRGRLRLATGDRDTGLADLRRARELDPSDAAVALAMALAVNGAGGHGRSKNRTDPTDPTDPSDILAALEAVVRLRPDDPDALIALGEGCARAGRWQLATEAFAAAIRAAPERAEPHAGMASSLRKMGRGDDADYHRGLYLLTRDALPEAVAAFRALAAWRATDPEPVLMVSVALAKMKRNLLAAREVERALARFPSDAAVRERVAMLAVLTRDVPLARRICEAWRADEPSSAQPHWILGRIAANETQWDEAIAHYRTALRLAPEHLDAALDLGRALMEGEEKGHLEEARSVLAGAGERAPGRAEIHLYLALAHERLGELLAARDALLRALDRDSAQPAALNALVRLAPRLDRRERAGFYAGLVREIERTTREEERRWRALWEEPSDPSRYVAMGRFYLDQGNLTRARYQFENGLAKDSDHAEARRWLRFANRLREVE